MYAGLESGYSTIVRNVYLQNKNARSIRPCIFVSNLPILTKCTEVVKCSILWIQNIYRGLSVNHSNYCIKKVLKLRIFRSVGLSNLLVSVFPLSRRQRQNCMEKVPICPLVERLFRNHLPYTEVKKYGNRPQEVRFSNFKKYDFRTSGGSIIELK